MPAVNQAILVDLFNLGLLVMALAMPAYSWVRAQSPLADWDRKGNVWTGPFHGFDMLVVVLLTLLARHLALSSGTSEDTIYTAGGVLSGSFLFLLLAGAICLLLAVRGHSLAELFGLDRLGPRAIFLWSFFGAIAAILATQGFAWLWNHFILGPAWTRESEQSLVTLLRESPDQKLRLAIVLSACCFQPLAEEVIFRGYFYPALKKQTDRPMAALLSSLVFAGLHLHVPALGPLFFLGILLVIAYERSGSLWVPIAIHALFNTATVLHQIIP